ncbi:MAG: 30S ribosomal protein S9, partial [Paracoccus sp. (in: a-proteobacteria)]
MAEDIKSLDDLKSAVSGTPAAVVEAAVNRQPQRDDLGRSYATGKRKDAVARVWVKPGSGKVTVNGKDIDAYFARPVLQMILRQP